MLYDIYLAPHEILEIYSQIDMVEKADGFIECYQKINVASLLLRAARIGAEHADLLNVKLPPQFRLMLLYKFLNLIKARDLDTPLCGHKSIIPSYPIADDGIAAVAAAASQRQGSNHQR
jgi:hypothetical protein